MSRKPSFKLLAQAADNYWAQTVNFSTEHISEADAMALFAEAARCSISTAQQKIQAIRCIMGMGYSAEEVIRMGQNVVLSRFQTARREARYEEKVKLTFHCFGSLAERVRRGMARLCHDEECVLDAIAEALETAEPHQHS